MTPFDIPRQVSKHTLPFIFRYFAIYVDILFEGYFINDTVDNAMVQRALKAMPNPYKADGRKLNMGGMTLSAEARIAYNGMQ